MTVELAPLPVSLVAAASASTSLALAAAPAGRYESFLPFPFSVEALVVGRDTSFHLGFVSLHGCCSRACTVVVDPRA